MPSLKPVVHADLVRFRVPAGWIAAAEDGNVVLHAPAEADGGSLRVLAEVLEGEGLEARLLEMATRFVHPNDVRAGDRTVERLPDGALLASLHATAEAEGARLAFYLWMKGQVSGGRAVAALFSYALPAERDGDPAFAAVIGLLDAEIRAAKLG
jgi:hypothetical protein